MPNQNDNPNPAQEINASIEGRIDEIFAGNSNDVPADDVQQNTQTPENSPQEPQAPAENDLAGQGETPEGGDVPAPENNNDGQNAGEPEEPDEALPEGFSPAQQQQIGSIIGKIKGKFKTRLQETNALLEAEKSRSGDFEQKLNSANAELLRVKAEGVRPQPLPDNPLAGQFASDEAYQNFKRVQFGIKQQIISSQNEDGAVVTLPNGNVVNLSPEQARTELVRIDKLFQFDVPAYEAHRARDIQWNAYLAREVPEAVKPNSKLSVLLDNITVKFPAIKTIPGSRTAAFYFILGESLAQKLGGAKAWDFVSSDKPIAAQGKVAAPVSRAVPPPTISKKPVAPASGVKKTIQRADGPLTDEALEEALLNRLG